MAFEACVLFWLNCTSSSCCSFVQGPLLCCVLQARSVTDHCIPSCFLLPCEHTCNKLRTHSACSTARYQNDCPAFATAISLKLTPASAPQQNGKANTMFVHLQFVSSWLQHCFPTTYHNGHPAFAPVCRLKLTPMLTCAICLHFSTHIYSCVCRSRSVSVVQLLLQQSSSAQAASLSAVWQPTRPWSKQCTSTTRQICPSTSSLPQISRARLPLTKCVAA